MNKYNKKNIFQKIILLIFIPTLNIGLACSDKNIKDNYYPKWIDTPSYSGGFYWSVGYSEGKNNLSDAYTEAIYDGKSKLAQIVESKITSTVKSLYESVETKNFSYSQKAISSEIKIKSSATLKKVLVDKIYYKLQTNHTYKYYILLKIKKQLLDDEMKRLENIFIEKIASVDNNLKSGDKYLNTGYLSDALEKYILAAINSTRVPERVHRFNTIILMIRSILQNVSFTKYNDYQQGSKLNGLKKHIKIKVQYRYNHKTRSAKKTNIKFLLLNNPGSKYDRFAVTNNAGLAQSLVRKIKKSGQRQKIIVSLDLNKAIDGFDVLVSPKWRQQKALLEEAIDDTHTTFYYSVP